MGKKVKEQAPDEYLLIVPVGDIISLIRIYMAQKTGLCVITDDYKVNFDEKLAQEALEYLMKLYENGVLVPFEETVATPEVTESMLWQNSKCGMTISPSSAFSNVLKNSNFEIGHTSIPIFKDAKDTAVEIRPAQIMSIYAKSKHITETAKFLNWLLGSVEAIEILKDTRGVPANTVTKKYLEEKKIYDPIIADITNEAIKIAGKPPSDLSFNSEIEKIFEDVIGMVAYKKITPAEGAKLLVEQITEKVNELKD